MSMLKNAQMTTPGVENAPITNIPVNANRNSFANGASLDYKLATLRNEMVNI